MKNSAALALISVLMFNTACDKIPFLKKDKGQEQQTEQQAEPRAQDQAPAAQQPQPSSAARPAPRRTGPTTRQAPPPAPRSIQTDEPYSPTDTGTVRPGMSRSDVVAVWGEPAAERTLGQWTYLYYRNGCEASCGTFDVVFFEKDQVLDAVVRGAGHTYAGISSSPVGRQAQFTPPDSSETGAAGSNSP